MRRAHLATPFATLLAALLALPLRSDGVASCDNVTTSLQSTIMTPVSGDEKFFTLPVGPSNMMFLIDASGSMNNIPQCGDAGSTTWGGTQALSTCNFPTWTAPSTPASPSSSKVWPPSTTVATNGSCNAVGTGSNSTLGPYLGDNLKWMSAYTPTTTLVDPGKGTASNGLVDAPPWGTGCTGNGCLFTSSNLYEYGSWDEVSATPVAAPCQVATIKVTSWDCTVTPSVQRTVTIPVTDPLCQSCTGTTGPGFYFYNQWSAKVLTFTNSSCTASTTTTFTQASTACGSAPCITNTPSLSSHAAALMTGGWLNADPPKFMSARKVIKESAWIDPNQSRTTDQLRIGMSYFSSDITNGAAIIVPVGPSQTDSYPVNPTAFVAARQLVFDALNHRNWPTGGLPDLISGGTPMATALFHLGQYFTQTTCNAGHTSCSGVYTSKFGSSFELQAFAQDAKGLMNAPWVTQNQTKSICWNCQKSAIVLVTDGSPNSEITFPSAIQTYDDTIYRSTANCNTGTTCSGTTPSKCCSPTDTSAPSRLPRIAAWLHENDLHPSDLDRAQTLVVSAVSVNLPAGNAQSILQAAANMSGGLYNNAADGRELATAVAQAVSQVSNTATSFGAPAATALSTINAVDTKAFVTRFKPNQKPTWEGHVFEWMLFDEAAAGCDPTKKTDDPNPVKVTCRGKEVLANFNGDGTADGFNVCTGSFLVDADCDEVTEDQATGKWFKKGSGGLAAHMFWDAGNVLSNPTATGYRTAAEPADTGNVAPATRYAAGKTPRNIWTALPDGTMYALETKNATTLAPYMNLDQTWCGTMESFARLCSGSGCPVTNNGDWKTYCAQQVILFARGWDVMDQDGDGCAGPGNPSNGSSSTSNTTATGSISCVISGSGTGTASGEERDRQNDAYAATGSTNVPSFYKLGDVFHSAPVLVHPPTSEAICQLGADNQCVRTAFGYTGNERYMSGYQTRLATYPACKSGAADVDAYRAWRNGLKDRESAVLVGSNDGFLHAFDAGGPDTVSPSQQDVDCVWSGTQDGTGEELWAFVPPDLLPRLRDTMMNHQYMVDGNVMIRDVWADGVAGTGNSLDGVKQQNEFRTLAVMTERSGGTQFTALDVTSAFSTTASDRPRPTMLWSFPPPRSDDAQYMGESWSDFSPRPPPIGAVRLVPTSGDRDPQSKGWVEKWVVMINGGYDPTLNRGRAVWMVDAISGDVVWRYTDSDFKTNVVGASASTTTSMFPVPAGVALMDIGDPTAQEFDSDNFFDTATWGDMGGNLFVARFDQPGVRDASGRVTNWRAARTFEQGRRTNNAQYATDRTEFFYMTANAYEPQRRALRTLVGSGNREQILEQGQGCGPDNVFSCCQASCTVATASRVDYGVCNSNGSFACNGGQMTSGPLVEGCGATGASACTGGASNTFNSSASFNLNCGSGAQSTVSASATCDATGLCTVAPVGLGHDVVLSTSNTCSNKARFYGIWSYGGIGIAEKTFSTASTANWSTAQTFDQNRFTDVADYRGCTFTTAQRCSLVETTQARVDGTGALSCADGSARCQANVDDPGWFYQYNTGPCPTQAACTGACTNEKTASGAAVVNSCATWNSFLPLGSAQSGSDPCSGARTATQTAIGYASHYVTGTPDAVCNENKTDSTIYRGEQRNTIAPPSAPMVRMGISQSGHVYYSTLQLDPGVPPSNTGLGVRDLASPLYWLEVPRSAHACRHVAGDNCE